MLILCLLKLGFQNVRLAAFYWFLCARQAVTASAAVKHTSASQQNVPPSFERGEVVQVTPFNESISSCSAFPRGELLVSGFPS